jgi:hypothetical protein
MRHCVSASSSTALSTLLIAALLGLCPHPARSETPSASANLPEAPLPPAPPHPGPTPGNPEPPAPSPVLFYTSSYDPPTRHDAFHAYVMEVIGPRPLVSAGISAGIEQARSVPIGWGQDFPGYLQRFGSAYSESAIDSTTRFGLASLFHEDVRYFPCYGCSIWDKYENAVLAEVSARRGQDGHRAFSPTPILAGFSGPLVAYNVWYPPGYSNRDALHHAALGFITRIGFHLLREFIVDRKP